MPFTVATGRARGPEMELTPPTRSNLSLPGWEPGLGGGCSLAGLEG